MLYPGHGRLWVLVADHHRARIVAPSAIEGQFHTIQWLGVAEHPHYPPPLRHTAHREPASQFAADIAQRLNAWAEQDRFDDLVLAAPEPVARDIRCELSRNTLARLAGTLAQDCAGLNDAALSQRLAQWWLPLPGQLGAECQPIPEQLDA
jgi:protein required for attachment to host cells